MLALIAGAGALPPVLAPRAGLVAALKGNDTRITPDLTFRLEHLGTLLADLQTRGVTEVCFAGAVTRPEIDPTRIDAATRPLAPRLGEALANGDDSALRIILDMFEEAGFTIRAAHDIAPDLLPPAGVLTRAEPDAGARAMADRAARVLQITGPADIGQGCVARAGQIIAMEAALGTDWMLASLKGTGEGGLFYKAPKPGQDRRVDLPTIGPDTVAGAKAAGLDGIAIEADGVIMLDRAQTIAAADAAGLFLWVRP